jgi:hypothetical protein
VGINKQRTPQAGSNPAYWPLTKGEKMGKIYLLKLIGETYPKSAMEKDTNFYMYDIETEKEGEVDETKKNNDTT